VTRQCLANLTGLVFIHQSLESIFQVHQLQVLWLN
jgi:hypothetical protein